MTGRLIKGVGGKYTVYSQKENFVCSAKGSIKLSDKLIVGDIVEFENLVIKKIYPRKNFLLRPAVCNVEQVLCIIAPIPKPDFLLIDKLQLKCQKEKVDFVIAINKLDLSSTEFSDLVEANYSKSSEIVKFSAKTGENIEYLRQKLTGKLTCFCGQSAVGKSTTLNTLFELDIQTNELSKKIERGKHTTRHSEIFVFDDMLVCDTPGFSSFELDLDTASLAKLYPEFELHSKYCRFSSCNHISEPDCGVKNAVKKGEIFVDRYERYLTLSGK